jgi:hypothetical protein
MKALVFSALICGAMTLATAAPSFALAVRNGLPGTFTNLAPNDDGSTGTVNLGFSANFFGTTYTDTFVNNNGNVTFGNFQGTFTPTILAGSQGLPIIAPFFADVDTRNAASGLVNYGQSTVDGRSAFVVNWPGVGYFPIAADKLNTFQLVLVDRSDIGAGDFDMEFNYDQVQWETGNASGGVNGLGGTSVAVGYSNGAAGASNVSFQLPGSFVNGALIDGGPNALISSSLNSNVAGRYLFNVRGGVVATDTGAQAVPVPPQVLGTVLVAALGALKKFSSRRKVTATQAA